MNRFGDVHSTTPWPKGALHVKMATTKVKEEEKTSDATTRSTKRHHKKEEELDDPSVTEAEVLRLKNRGYTLKKKLSQGCSAKIYLTTYTRANKADITMACKVIDKKNGEPKFITKFLPREVTILSELSNPHCVQIYSILEIKSKCFVFMRYAENGDLLDYLTKHGAVEESHARMWMRQLLLAVRYLQSKRIAHRDIKCENVLITDNLNAKLADFGFARYWIDPQGDDVLSETYCGSLSYAAPEILRGHPYSPKKCDIWSLGIVFFVMLNLAKPFSKNKAAQLLQQQLEKNYRFRSKTISAGAKDLIRSMLEPNIDIRPLPEVLLNVPWMKEDELLLKLVPDPLTPSSNQKEITYEQEGTYTKMKQLSRSSYHQNSALNPYSTKS
ncbi:testis-specific serine/threonine-protein kinase 3 [Halyomorpha halys]|uniref:testis-specific serine/threonine-protein kinase 3 n=1 Tax=Halyomorpha halys TaxID=286706 RepID=UPI0006D4E6D1|nr:testis-specific serine/threonine-protein kinase 3 [Halyomorpha halys]